MSRILISVLVVTAGILSGTIQADDFKPEAHWAYRPLGWEFVSPGDGGAASAIDRFVAARLDSDAVRPSPQADRKTLIKRLYYDLLGLPPRPERVDAFVASTAPDAYEQLVDELLASPRFGERWGRHWLDRVRYADSDGYEKDNSRPDAYRFRDWVIDAINRDLPYDRFVILQVAGDLLDDGDASKRLATAFHRQTLTNTEGGTDQEEFRVAAVMDRVETFGTVWLGLTVGCARCHTHKYDLITQDEYFQLFAFFNNADETTTRVPRDDTSWVTFQDRFTEHQAAVAQLESRIKAAGGAEKAQDLAERLKHLKASDPSMAVRVVAERKEKRRATHLLHRGDFLQPEHEVQPGTLGVLPAIADGSDETPGRLDLARWLVSGDNPLPPRVVVNQIWTHLFGFGLVRTVNDFGVRGEPPTHPQLLDWLATEFIHSGWSRKQLIRAVVLSGTYQQASRHRPELADVDPNNRLLARQNRFRVEAEIVRDLSLSVAGLLSDRIGGPSVFPPIPPSITDLTYNSGFKWATSTGADRYRRGLYTYFKRTAPHPNLTTFDCPDSTKTCVARDRSNTPIGALVTLNNEVFVEAARAFAGRVQQMAESDEARLGHAVKLCLARDGNWDEIEVLQELLEQSRAWYRQHPDEAMQLAGQPAPGSRDLADAAAWVATVRTLLNLDEFLTRE